MGFILSKRSLSNLEGVHEGLVRVVHRASEISEIGFTVIEGVRTLERQRQLVAKGASQTLHSKHLEGHAVDLAAYIEDRISWELTLYDDVADAIKIAAIEEDVAIRWGAAWHIDDIREWDGTMQDAMNQYIDLRRAQGKRPFIDAPHFEVVTYD